MARVLIVDDEPDYVEEVARALRRDHHFVSETKTALEAVIVTLEEQPQLLFVDWMLKDAVHGLELARALQFCSPGLQVLLMTGFAPSQLVIGKAPLLGVLEKPFPLSAAKSAARELTPCFDDMPHGGAILVREDQGYGSRNLLPHWRNIYAHSQAGREKIEIDDEVFQLRALPLSGQETIFAVYQSSRGEEVHSLRCLMTSLRFPEDDIRDTRSSPVS